MKSSVALALAALAAAAPAVAKDKKPAAKRFTGQFWEHRVPKYICYF